MSYDDMNGVLQAVHDAYNKARAKHAPMRGPHEGYAVILEEFEELWDEIKRWQPLNSNDPQEIEKHAFNLRAMRKEALHTAAMVCAFLLEVCK